MAFDAEMIPKFSEDEFNSTAPYEYLLEVRQKEGECAMVTAQSLLAKEAKKNGIAKSQFTQALKGYMKDYQRIHGNTAMNTVEYVNDDLVLNCGNWEADETGVYGYDRFGCRIQACSHPIMPIRRYENIETGEIKIELAFKRGNAWKTMVVDKKTISSNSSILDLAIMDVAVTSENSRYLVSYLSDVESLNYDVIPKVKSTTKMGWIGDGLFAPYSDDIKFDGDSSFSQIYDSITNKGSYAKWKDVARKIRKGNVYARIVLASSFASVIIKDCKLLPFFVHLWGGTESGKTVSIMVAASVWGNPELGKFPQTFNSTTVAQEMLAGFVNSLPLIMDELQMIKDRNSFDEMIYKLTEGVGKNRGKKDGGVRRTLTWRNCMLTTGEYPIVNSHSGSGAVNRIIEIDCKDVKFFRNPNRIVDLITENYGFAGKEFVKYLMQDGVKEKVIELQKNYYHELEKRDNMAKQAAAASAILAADEIVTDLIFKDGQNLTIDDLAPLLVSRFKASQNERAYEYLCDTVDINRNRFEKNSYGDWSGEVWGCVEHDIVYIIKSKFDEMIENGGYNSKSFISWAIQTGKIKPKNAASVTVVKRIDNSPCRCIALVREGEKKDVKVAEPQVAVSQTGKEVLPLPEEPKQEDIFSDFDFNDEYDII